MLFTSSSKVCGTTPLLYFCVCHVQQHVEVVLHQGLSQELQLRAYLHASHLACNLNQVCAVQLANTSMAKTQAASFHSSHNKLIVTLCTCML
jgi:hypothetical protein